MPDRQAALTQINLDDLLEEQQLLASALQLMCQLLSAARLVTIHVQIGNPITPTVGTPFDGRAFHVALLAEMRHLIEHAPLDAGESAL